MASTTDRLRACTLAVLVVLSAVVVGASGALAAADGTHDGSIDRLDATGHGDEADAVLRDGNLYYLGMQLAREDDVDPNEDIEVLDSDGDLVTLAFADEDGHVVVDTSQDAFESGRYTLVKANGDEIATFRLLEQSFSVDFDDSEVSNEGSDTTTTASVRSNRRSYTIHVSASREGGGSIGPSVLEDVFGTGTPVDTDGDGRDDALRLPGSDSTSFDMDFDDRDQGIYDFTFRVPDTGKTATQSVTVGEEATGDARIDGSNVIRDHRGDVPEITVSLTDTDRATVAIGDRNVNYRIEATVRDNDGDGEVTLRWNTDRAGRDSASRVVSAESGRVVSATRTIGGFGNDRRIAAAQYPVEVSVGGQETDTGEVDLLEPGAVTRSVTILTASGDRSSDEVVDEATTGNDVAVGDFVVVRIRSAGIHAAIQSRADLINEPDGISVTVRETDASAGNSPRKRIDLTTFQFESRANDDDIYLFARSNQARFETGDTYRVTFEIDASDNPYISSDVSRQTTFTIVTREVSVDTGIDDVLRVQSTTERVCGSSSLPQGQTVSLELRNVGGETLRQTARATVDENGRFCTEFDFSDVDVGQQFRITVVLSGEDVGMADGTVVERGQVSVSDQRLEEGRIVTVDSATLPDGGFVVIRRASDDAILGWSRALSPGTTEDLDVTLEEAIQSRTDVRVTIHRNNGQGTFDQTGEVDIPYRFDGSEVDDEATLRVGTDTATTTERTTTATTTTETTTTTIETVETTETTETTTTTTQTTTSDGDGGLPVPGFGLGAAVVALLAALLLRRRLR